MKNMVSFNLQLFYLYLLIDFFLENIFDKTGF